MLFNIPVNFHQDTFYNFQVTERTALGYEFSYFPFQRAITPKLCNPELLFLCSACRLLLDNTPVNFHQDTLNGFQVTERTRLTSKVCISKGHNSKNKNMQSRVMVLVFFTPAHGD